LLDLRTVSEHALSVNRADVVQVDIDQVTLLDQLIEFLTENNVIETAVGNSPDRPVGVLIVCRSPLGSTKPVTTIIAAGPAKYGTLQASREDSSRSERPRIEVDCCKMRDR
jgi:hypothetical protein